MPEPAYPVASGGNSATTHYGRISDNTITFSPASLPVTSITVTAGGTGYSATTTVSIAAPGCVAPCATATAAPTIVGGVITAITVINGGSGYAAAPLVTITDPTSTGSGATATPILTATYTYGQKAIQELFTLDYGRMNATLGTEIPLTNFLLRPRCPSATRNGRPRSLGRNAQTRALEDHAQRCRHPLHSLPSVQRAGDQPHRLGRRRRSPDANELGWKDTVRMNPLENIVVAMQPVEQTLPFPLPDSIRSLDVTMPDGVISPAISGIDPGTGNAITGGGGPPMPSQLRPGVRVALPHPRPRRKRHDAAHHLPGRASRTFGLCRGARCNRSSVLTWTDNAASESGFNLQEITDPLLPCPVHLLPIEPSLPSTAYGVTITVTDSAGSCWHGPSITACKLKTTSCRSLRSLGSSRSRPCSPRGSQPRRGAMTTTVIQAPAINYGQNGLVTVSVTSAGGAVIGNVTLTVDAGAPITVALTGGVAA